MMTLRRMDSEMIRRTAEEIQIIVEEQLAQNICSLAVLKAGKEKYSCAMDRFWKVSKEELEKLVKRLHNFKITEEDGVIKFCLDKPIGALKTITNLLEIWVLPFVDTLKTEEEWAENLRLLEGVHVKLVDKVGDLSEGAGIEDCLSKADRSFMKERIKAREKVEDENNNVRVNRLSLKKRVRK